jgi:putative ABC transport system permease protein
MSDIARTWRQGLAICAVLASGVATFVMSTSTIRSLDDTREAYYRDYRFGDVFVQLTRAPNSLASRLREIPGVSRVETRVVRDVIIDIPSMQEPVTGRLVSLPDNPQTSLNAVHLLRGRFPDPVSRHEALASELFAQAHGWRPGQEVDVLLGGRKQRLRIVGMAMSPEYIYAVQPGQLLADNRRFGVFWMPYRQMAAAFNMEGAFNDVSFELLPHSSVRNVLFHIDQLTEPYGGRSAYDRDNQMSHRRISDEMHQLRGMAMVSPSIFLAVAAFLFNIMLSRMVNQQREQIATLRAFGYRRWEIGRYYIKLLAILVVIGCVVGSGAGFLLSRWMTNVYVRFFRFPVVRHEIAYEQAIVAALVSLAGAATGGVSAIRKAMQLPPAVAMRPDAPMDVRDSILEKIGLQKLLSPVARLILRRMERNRRSTSLSILGMACAVAVLMLGTFMGDTIDYVIDVQFQRTQRQDVTLTFNEPLSAHALHDVCHLPGVASAEPFRAVPVVIRHGTHQRRMSLMGLERHPRLFRVLDDELEDVPLDTNGLTISKKLAEILAVEPGSEVVIDLLDGSRQQHVVRVGSVFPDYTDPGAYLDRFALHRMLMEEEQLSGAFLAVDPRQLGALYTMLKNTPTLAAITVKSAAIQNFNDTIKANLGPMRMINALFAFIIAFGVIYNCALITLSERSRDLATLRVMGFSRGEVAVILLGEIAIITAASIPVGLPLGYGFCYLATLALDTETHRFPLVVERATFAYSASVVLIAAVCSSLIVRRMLNKLDLIAVLKTKE